MKELFQKFYNKFFKEKRFVWQEGNIEQKGTGRITLGTPEIYSTTEEYEKMKAEREAEAENILAKSRLKKIQESPEILEQIQEEKHASEEEKLVMAQDLDTPPERLDRLAKEEGQSLAIKEAIAANLSTSTDTLIDLDMQAEEESLIKLLKEKLKER
jgi:hypothetical protein